MYHLQIKQYFKSNNKIISHDAGEIALDIKRMKKLELLQTTIDKS